MADTIDISKSLRDVDLAAFFRVDNTWYRRVRGDIEARPSGLTVGGQHTIVTINDSSWTALNRSGLTDPVGTGPLENRNALTFQNNTGFQFKINYDNSVSGYKGITVNDNDERNYDITDNIIIYAKAEPGAGSIDVDVEELA